MGSKRFLIITGAIVLALTCCSLVSLTQARNGPAKQSEEAARAENAATVLSEIMEAPDQGIPEALLKRAYGMAVIPHAVKGTFGIGGPYRKGLIAQRNVHGG